MSKLQNITFNSEKCLSPAELYYHGKLDKFGGRCVLSFGNVISFDGYNNVLSIDFCKEKLGLRDVVLRIDAEGSGIVTVYCYKEERSIVVLSEKVDFDKHKSQKYNIDISNLSGLLFIEVLSLSHNGLEFFSICWEVTKQFRRDVELGIVLTHFNNQESVRATVKRFSSLLIDEPFLRDNLHLVIVDNSQNYDDSELPKNTYCVKNLNFGGSGGFTRGLLFIAKELKCTHALFMDDDASTDMESVLRIFNYLGFYLNDRLCISGTLLKKEIPHRIHEKGGLYINNDFYPICSGLDVDNLSSIQMSESEAGRPNYGAWCCFAFPIKEIKHLPFPFFIHGDDVLFSLSNKLEVDTPIGIFSYIDDFLGKESPFRVFLDTRNYLFLTAFYFPGCRAHVLRYLRPYLNYLFSYQYDNLIAMRLGLKETYGNENTWTDLENLFRIKKYLDDNCKTCRLTVIPFATVQGLKSHNRNKYPKLKKILKILTIYGQIAPHKNDVMLVPLGSGAWRDGFYHKSFLFYHKFSSKGYTVKHSYFRFLQFSFYLLMDTFFIYRNKKDFKSKVTRLFDSMTDHKSWIKLFEG